MIIIMRLVIIMYANNNATSMIDQCSLLGFGESVCAQKFVDFPTVNNEKSKNEPACAQ